MKNNTILTIEIVIPVVVGTILIFYVSYYVNRIIMGYWNNQNNQNNANDNNRLLKQNWRRFTSTLRGNLVRTYNSPIEDDFHIDIEHEIGKGGVGVVVVGERKDNHELYAIKFVNKATAELGRLDRELKLLKDVDHTNIVRLFSVYDSPARIYFVMELCTGGHLGYLHFIHLDYDILN